MGAKINYDGIKHIRDLISKDRDNFLKLMHENTYFHVNDEITKHDFSLLTISEIFDVINRFTSDISNVLKNHLNVECKNVIPVKKVSSGSIHLSFSMGDESTDLNEIILNYEIFNIFFDILECQDSDLPNLKDKIGDECLQSYMNFLKVFIKNKLSFTLENSSRRVHFTPEDALNVFNIISKK